MKYLLYIIFFLLIISCRKECPKSKRNYNTIIDTMVISYFASYKDGSYWIYEDSTAGIVDTINLSNYKKYYYQDNEGSCDYKEMIIYKLTGLFFNKIYVNIQPDIVDFGVNNLLFSVTYYDGIFIHYIDSIIQNEFISNMIINNQSYSDVLVMKGVDYNINYGKMIFFLLLI